MNKVKVLIAAKNSLVRKDICTLLEVSNQIKVVGEISDAGTIENHVSGNKADVVVMDMDWPGMDETEIVRMIRKNNIDIKVVILADQNYKTRILHNLKAGANSIILKKAMSTDLISAILTVYEGGYVLYPSIARTVVNDYMRYVNRIKRVDYYDRLTEQEKHVLKLMAEGFNTREIADLTFFDVQKVREYRINIMKKLAINDRSELVKYAINHSVADINSR
ncbi:MAG: response regulator transcription factor [Chloroflexi bacterium]|jgi:two-component system, NarL family, response regulator NreC|nr:response regulator transcription factor [Chloroflexota bacterium]MBT7081046.1 response regulator transcription factor [Chloroflexota bacterium]